MLWIFIYFLSHSQQTGSKSEGGAAVISTVVLCCDVEADLKQLSILHEECTQDAIFIRVYSLDQCSGVFTHGCMCIMCVHAYTQHNQHSLIIISLVNCTETTETLSISLFPLLMR